MGTASLTVKLNESIRNRIVKALISKKFDEREADFKTRRETLAQSIYHEAFDGKERKLMDSLPEGWLPTAHTVKARLGGDDMGFKLPGEQRVRVPKSKFSYSDETQFLVVLDAGHPITVAWKELAAEERETSSEKDILSRQIRQMVYSVSTANKLVTVWPEVEPVVRQIVGTSAPVNLPAPIIKDLNRALGLTVAA